MQSDNKPQELIDNPLTFDDTTDANRTKRAWDYGFDIGGPVVRDRVFFWGAFRKSSFERLNHLIVPEKRDLNDANLKVNVDLSQSHRFDFHYFHEGFNFQNVNEFPNRDIAPESLADISRPAEILSAGYSWIPDDHTALSARYGFTSHQSAVIPRGGIDNPVIFRADRWEGSAFYIVQKQSIQDVSVDLNHLEENWLGGDHELRFGSEYKTSELQHSSSAGNGQFIFDYFSDPGGPLTEGYSRINYPKSASISLSRTSFYGSDTYRRNRLMLTLGLRFDRQSGKNNPTVLRPPKGYADSLPLIEYRGQDPGVSFDDLSPRFAASYDLLGDGKTLLRGTFARFYDAFDPSLEWFSNPGTIGLECHVDYQNRNHDRFISLDETSGGCYYLGPGFETANFNLALFYQSFFTTIICRTAITMNGPPGSNGNSFPI